MKEALDKALEALEYALPALEAAWYNKSQSFKAQDAITAIKRARSAPAQEPCGWQFYQDGKWHNGMETSNHRVNTEAAGIPVRNVYPTPPAAQRHWVGLTDEEVINVMPDDNTPMSLGEAFSKFAELLEAKLKENNT